MPLTRCNTTPLVDVWGVYFNMLRRDQVSVQCFVTRGALDELAGGDGKTALHEQLAIFDRWRDEIERAASQLYDTGCVEALGVVMVRPEHVAKLKR